MIFPKTFEKYKIIKNLIKKVLEFILSKMRKVNFNIDDLKNIFKYT